MIEEVQKGCFYFLNKKFNEYGLDFEFRYSQDLDLLTEFRKSPRLRIEFATSLKDIVDRFSTAREKSNQLLGLFTRSPLRRSSLFGNNQDINLYNCSDSTSDKALMRLAYNAEFTINVKLLFDNNQASDIAEMVYGLAFAGKDRSYKVSFDFGDNGIENISGIPYKIIFSDIDDISYLNSSNLRVMSFSMAINGFIITPFTYYENKIKKMEFKLIFTDGDGTACCFNTADPSITSIHQIDLFNYNT